MTGQHAVLYACDRRFLLPTVSSAQQVKAHHAGHRVFVALVGMNSSELATANSILADFGVETFAMPEVPLELAVEFNPTHVPPSALARFNAVAHLPPEIEHIVYIDGDTYIGGDLSALLDYEVPAGKILAGGDKFWLNGRRQRRVHREYLDGIGVSAHEYFNSGVMAFRRSTWLDKGSAALNFFQNNSALCKFHDQSALNHVFKGHRVWLHPDYNFITDYTLVAGYQTRRPRVIHFTGGHKPWFYDGRPWKRRYRSQFDSIRQAYPALDDESVRRDPATVAAMVRYERRQRLLHWASGAPILRWWHFRRLTRQFGSSAVLSAPSES